jgi:hypothetical protein
MNTPTPRTNRFYSSFADGECIPNQDEWLALCESIESELTAACQEIDMLKSKYADHHAEAEKLTSEINVVTEQRDRLAAALWNMLNQEHGSAVKAGILLRSLNLQYLNPNAEVDHGCKPLISPPC